MSNGISSQKPRSSKSFHFLSGAISGTATAVLLQPVDLLKTRVQQSAHASLGQTLRDVFSRGNAVRQLWRGTVPSALRTGAGSALYFGGLNWMRRGVGKVAGTGGAGQQQVGGRGNDATSSAQHQQSLSKSTNLLTGALARASAGFAMMPITVIKVRYESSLYAYTSIYGAGKDILKNEGFRGFFAGFGATAVRDAPYAGLYVLFYEEGKKWVSKVSGSGGFPLPTPLGSSPNSNSTSTPPSLHLSQPTINFTSALLAATTATLLTNPFDAIKTRLQLEPARYGNMGRAAVMMVRGEGIRSLFDGLGLRMVRKGLSSALAWTVYEELIRRVEEKAVI
ncbi:solute carrier family 25 member 38 [Aulographum hederae CBS 113979]|uniref:Mitochondrial glycine transporter n=1 Tax=Aulographum hederae CBS 113979 TaxID=1176131 RepID=A0A6G1GV41_9PEZI|nr:solute carrier family 25 member 38 [Aulographum hederae CBS 113979]